MTNGGGNHGPKADSETKKETESKPQDGGKAQPKKQG